jgi:uncharacterized protein (TIGR02271 family)
MATQPEKDEIVIPVVAEELQVDKVSVPTGGVRIIKSVSAHEEIVEQELRRERVEVRRVPVHRVVDGPQPIIQTEDTLIVPIVQEILKIEREWVVTEEIHISRSQESQTHQERVVLNREEAKVEHYDLADPSTDKQNPQ